MSFDDILGQAPAVETLSRALRAGKLHHAYRFEGPAGVGKELTAFALARALVCEAPTPLACGACSACSRAATLSDEEPHVPRHPDVVLVGRGVYPSSVLGSSVTESTSISVEQIRRVVLTRSGYPPHEGRGLVFIVRDADELSIQAANSLLKTLEEPKDRTTFLLLSSRPNRLLDTIRSRTLAVRFGPLSVSVLQELLRARGLPAELASQANGSAARALELADADRAQERDAFTDAVQQALSAADATEALDIAKNRPEDRHALRELLAHLAHRFAEESKARVTTEPEQAVLWAERHGIVLASLNDIERNVQPALALEAMLLRMRNA
ncbi:MAG: DNA polymerase III subunit [Polyangiaceae bacterium]